MGSLHKPAHKPALLPFALGVQSKSSKNHDGSRRYFPLTASELLVHDAQLKPLVTSSRGAICPHLASSRSCHGSPRLGRICTAAWGSAALGQCPHNEHCHVGNHLPPGRTARHGPSVDLPASSVGMAAPPLIHEEWRSGARSSCVANGFDHPST